MAMKLQSEQWTGLQSHYVENHGMYIYCLIKLISRLAFASSGLVLNDQSRLMNMRQDGRFFPCQAGSMLPGRRIQKDACVQRCV